MRFFSRWIFEWGFLFKSNTLDRDKKKKKKFGLFSKSGDRKDTQSGDESDNEQDNLEPVPSYELVTQHEGKKQLFGNYKYKYVLAIFAFVNVTYRKRMINDFCLYDVVR